MEELVLFTLHVTDHGDDDTSYVVVTVNSTQTSMTGIANLGVISRSLSRWDTHCCTYTIAIG
jgi:hypothetical protein